MPDGPHYDGSYTFKIVVGGADGVGKTTLLHRYVHGDFIHDSLMTIGVALQVKEAYCKRLRKMVKLSMWDLGGQPRFRFLQASYMSGALAGIVFFDMTRLDTMAQVREWVWSFRGKSPGMPIVLGGTKLDALTDPLAIDETFLYAKDVADQLGLLTYIPTSSKTGDGIDEIFSCIIDALADRCQNVE